FLQVDNVDPVTFAKDVFLHLWIPALGLVPEVNAGFEQFLHRNRRQNASLCCEWFRPVAIGAHGPKRNLCAQPKPDVVCSARTLACRVHTRVNALKKTTAY